MQAILTKFLPPTNNRAARIKAWCDRGSVTIATSEANGALEQHAYAAKRLCAKFVAEDAAKYGADSQSNNPWAAPMTEGGLPQSFKHAHACFVFAA